MALAHCILGKFLGVVCHYFPPPLDVPTFAARCLYVRNDARDPCSERWNCGTKYAKYIPCVFTRNRKSQVSQIEENSLILRFAKLTNRKKHQTNKFTSTILLYSSVHWHEVAQLFEVQRRKPDGRGLDSQWCHWLNPSGRSMALGPTQPLTKLSTRDISWGRGWSRPIRRADNLTTFMCRLPRNSGNLILLELKGLVQACNGIALLTLLFSFPLISVIFKI